MPSAVPTPVAAALGVVPTLLDGARRLPARAVRLPILALTSALTGMDKTRREYDALAGRGERLLARLRGQSVDSIEDRFEDRLQGSRLAAPYDRVEDALEDATETVSAFVRSAPTKARKAAGAAAKGAGDRVDRAADSVEDLGAAVAGGADTADPGTQTSPDEEPKGAPTPKAMQPDATRVDTAARPEVVQVVEQISQQFAGTAPSADALPLPDYDHLTLGSLRGRMRSLDLEQLVTLRTYEKAHADRLPIVTMLDNRIAKLAADPTTELSAGGGASPVYPSGADTGAAASGGSKVSPATAGPKLPTASRGGLGDQNRLR
jgi:hypothetical protein